MNTRPLLAAALLAIAPAVAAQVAPTKKPVAPPAQGHVVVPWHGQRVLAEVRDGYAIVEGDIIVGSAEALAHADLGAKALAGTDPVTSKGHAFAYPGQLWTGSPATVPYTLTMTSLGNPDIAPAIAAFNATFAGVIQWTPRVAETDYVEFALSGSSSGCASFVGRAGGKQQITGGLNCNVAVLLHEIGHAVGLYHEQQRSDSVGRILFTPANLDLPLRSGNFGVPTSNFDVVGLYDFGSIMHYGRTTFSKNRLPVLDTVIPGIPFGEAEAYSAGDIDTIRRMYGATPTSVTVTTHPAGLPIIVDGNTLTSPQTFAWALDSVHTLNVPAGFQTRASDSARYSFASWNDGQAQSHGITVTAGNGERTQPGANPAVTVYQAEYARYNEVSTSTVCGNGTVQFSPPLTTIDTKQYALDGTLGTATALPGANQVFWRWFGTTAAFPQGENPKVVLVDESPTEVEPCFEATTPIYTVTAAFSNPPPPTSPANARLFGGTIDGDFEYLPQNFDALEVGNSWVPGDATHTVSVSDPAIPLTFNAQYDWTSWSDGGAATHTLAALPGTSTVYTANFTPRYRGFATEDPSNGCASSAASLPADQQYSDGQVVPFSVTAAAGWQFVGWTDALTGQPNPTNLTVHDQFAVVARFNTVATPLSITSLSPTNAVVATPSVPLIINGTGFTASSLVFVNGVFRASTFQNATRIDTTLSGADLATVGGIRITVDNRVNAPFCAIFVDATFDVRNAAGPPNKIFEDGYEGNP